MPDAFLLSSVSDSAQLRLGPLAFSDATGVSFLAELSGPVVSARVNVFDLTSSHLVAFFNWLAANWHDWEGTKAYASLEGQLKLEATRDSLGHVFVRVTVREDRGGADWHAEGTLTIEAGQLEGYSLSCQRVFSGQPAA